jgi:hypothetical protein
MKSQLRMVNKQDHTYGLLMFVCPGCVAGGHPGYDGIHMLPVNDTGEKLPGLDIPFWKFNGDTESPTLEPSILSHEVVMGTGLLLHPRCHSYLRQGVFQFLADCAHPLVGQFVPIPDLPDWAERLS